MAVIVITGFTGEQPRLLPRLLPATGAQDAINTRLEDGGLTPMRVALEDGEVSDLDRGTIYRHKGAWLSWPGRVDVAPAPVAEDRLYYTGDGVPKMRTADGTAYPLAVPRPAAAPTATLIGTGSGDVTSRVYVYTWVTQFGEETEPTPASNAVDWQPGNNVTLSGIEAPPAGRGVTRQRFYRSQTGSSGTGLYFIAERDASSADFTDTIAPTAFQDPIPSVDWNAPPDDLTGIIPMPNGMMAAFVGKRVYFCEPYRPHAWPEKYVLTVDSQIVGLGALGSTLVILTEAQPYLATGTHPSTMQMLKLEANLPCINARAIVDMGFAIAYPSHEGLVAVRGDGSAAIVSGTLFTRESWLEIDPEHMVAAQLAGRYVAFYRSTSADDEVMAGAVMIDIAATHMTRFATVASAAFFDVTTGGLYVQLAGSRRIMRIDPPEGSRDTLYWRSKPFILPMPQNFGALLVEADATVSAAEAARRRARQEAVRASNAAIIASRRVLGDMNAGPLNGRALTGDALQHVPPLPSATATIIYADGKQVASTPVTNTPMRLPAGFLANTWEVAVSSNARIEKITLATTIDELKGAPPG
ncbi:hypothetical protein [Chelatococcus sp. XZ-Ab1]|uniref:hypothetical protein n=1 Tax=Chelatococcus sp. XZ-Ab1 TaxID=3034027 RepID=UPI0023E40EC5|nr:hypothetical protein [Chelatococcus sp. XZ-Ab1]